MKSHRTDAILASLITAACQGFEQAQVTGNRDVATGRQPRKLVEIFNDATFESLLPELML
jgi:hypothetical protein